MNKSIKPQDIYQIIDNDYYFIDLRDRFQFEKLHLKNFINIPYEDLSNHQLLHNKPIILICYSGEKAKEIAESLSKQNYQAYYIEGGFQAYLNKPHLKYF